MPFAFKDSFSGYSFSFSLKYNTTVQLDGTNNPILNLPFTDTTGSNLALPFGNQFVLQPFGNAKAAYNTNNKTSSGDSAITAQGLSKLYGAALTPFSYTLDYDSNTLSTTITLTYNYGCITTANKIPPSVFTFKSVRDTVSSTCTLYVPYWSTDQITDSSGTLSSCYPQVGALKVHLEIDQKQADLYRYILLTTKGTSVSKFINQNPNSTDNSFPILYFRVQLDEYISPFNNNNFLRAFLTGSTNYGQQYKVFSGDVYDDPTRNIKVRFNNLSDQVSANTNTNTIGVLPCPNLQFYTPSGSKSGKNITINTRGSLLGTMGTFPTASGIVAVSDEFRILKNGDVGILKSTKNNSQNTGQYLSFQQQKNKAPSMSTTPQPVNNFLWQVVLLNSDGSYAGNIGDKISSGSTIGLFTYNCEGTSPQVCGWISNSKSSAFLPSISPKNVHAQCEVWKVVSKTLPYIFAEDEFAIQASNTLSNACQSQDGYLVNEINVKPLSDNQPPTVGDYGQNNLWTFSRVYNSQPLPS